MKSVIIDTYSIRDLMSKINQELEKGFKPTVAFIYTSVSHDVKKIVAELDNYPFMIFGATTVGEIFANEELGVNEVEGSIVCMLLEGNHDAFKLKFMHVEEDRYFEAGEDIGKWAKSNFDDPAVITMTSGLTFDNDAYVQGVLSQGIVYAFGGVAGDDLILKETYVFSGENFSKHGVIALAIDRSKIDVFGSRAFGWSGISKERIVTKADKNIVYEIDNKPAIDFYKQYLFVTDDDMPQTGIEYPLEVKLKNGHTVYRAVLAINEENGALIFAGHVPEKSRVRISSPKGREIIEYVSDSITKTLSEKELEPDIALVFPCCSRKQVLGNFTIKEIEAAYQAAKTPLVGCFVYGEIGAFPGGDGFHNETFVTAFLKEKEN